jgi:hypothetical protein
VKENDSAEFGILAAKNENTAKCLVDFESTQQLAVQCHQLKPEYRTIGLLFQETHESILELLEAIPGFQGS